MRLGYAMAVVCGVLVFMPASAHALQCTPAALDQSAYDDAALIFEGVVAREQTQSIGLNGQIVAQKKSHIFAVTKMWKGDENIQILSVDNDIRLPEDYAVGTPYLVVASIKDGQYTIPVCSYTRTLETAQDGLAFLNTTLTPSLGE